ncbi:MAG: DUF1614 domain-containing protein [Gammaproteobacteria bacterium]|nr:DUF1614 domain-containing protein [Gammaproteobacteria bacterium]MDE2262275.1 DUF1614 domain-containing protein [Gammaproteobacteria bacterium]
MHGSELQYFPVSLPFLLIFWGLIIVLIGLTLLRALKYASLSMGIREGTLITVLALSLLGSYINIPVAYLPGHRTVTAGEISFFGMTYIVPVVRQSHATILAVNVGGAIIPVCLSLYLLLKHRLFLLGAVGIAFVAAVCHYLARPVPGFGIALPIFVPALATAIIAVALTRRRAAPLAYISGSFGTLIGADLLNLGAIQALGAPVASIGGAGTFDGIFVTGLLAVLYAGLSRYLHD